MEPENISCPRLDASLRALKGVGPKIEKALLNRGLRSVEDLFYFLPVRYEDRSRVRPMADLTEGEESLLMGRVTDSGSAYSRRARKRLCHARLDDGTGTLVIKWFGFNKRRLADVCRKGNLLLVSGKISKYGPDFQIVHPRLTVLKEESDLLELSPVIPVYPEVEGVSQGVLRNIIERAFADYGSELVSLIPEAVGRNRGIASLCEAVRRSHFPGDRLPDEEPREKDFQRVVLEEFFLFQAALIQKRAEIRRTRGIPMHAGTIYDNLVRSLPFKLTAGQERVLSEVEHDMSLPEPMNRLLQGDVGSGKTVCAMLTASIALDSGWQVAIVAPTEILAEQHFLSFQSFLDEARVPYALLTGEMGRGRREVLGGIERGDISVVVGTHAVLQRDVAFHRLGLAIIDEQHRFGVIQRSVMKKKGVNPHMLVMSATPIPRSLSMVVYGSLEMSVLDNTLRQGKEVATRVFTERDGREIREMILGETAKGRQVFAVYPVLEEAQETGLQSAREGFEHMRALLPGLRVGLLHGRMKAEEKRAIMEVFRRGALDVLVCTTVVEVGIDVSNATLVIVFHAERFGLSQLHQLRGRVGRGPHPSSCILVSTEARSAAATKRLKILEKTADGFAIAEADMGLRGIGDMMGVRQAGIPAFRLGNIVRDSATMHFARDLATEAIASLDGKGLATLTATLARKWGERLHFGDVL
jgi:ATP-dependent DNA helicase RecG